MDPTELLSRLGVVLAPDGDLVVTSPIDGRMVGRVQGGDIAGAVDRAAAAFAFWKTVPAPRRGELVRLFAEALRRHKADLGRLITLESGKILQEGLGEVQEMIDICDFAVGLSRQLHGLTIASERPNHRLMEAWHPLGVVGIVSAFNFPAAVWAWNAALAWVCGNTVVWKPSEKTPLTALACQAIFLNCIKLLSDIPDGLCEVVVAGRDAAIALADDRRVALVSATGSTRMGQELAPRIAARLGRSLLELGGNNAAIVCPSADLALAVRAILFAAVGTAGQRCTTLRRLIVHEDIHDTLVASLRSAYGRIPIGDPRAPDTLMGPLIDRDAFEAMQAALGRAVREGGMVVAGGERIQVPGCEDGWYARPALVTMPDQTGVVREETFAPILYVMTYTDLNRAIAMNNAVAHGLSSSIFTKDLREAERFLAGSDCGIANVNIGPSGAEIGGAFGGEKDSGGGRESGSDCWKAYMRRATNTINYGDDLPLAQGIRFELEN